MHCLGSSKFVISEENLFIQIPKGFFVKHCLVMAANFGLG
jgi:hypothetical protein